MKKLKSFTIVELLVVIVVIGILASITIISYNGITTRAIASSLQSDLTNASKQLDLFKVDHDYYPLTIDCSIPDSDTNKCIKFNPANNLTYNPGTGSAPSTYILTATHTNTDTNYTITNNSTPIATAPLNPVADWLAMQTGDHYGNFYDLVSKQYATVNRATPKTIYDPTTNKIYDVPPNSLGIRPRSDGKAGFEAEVEESRTNLLKYSNGQNTSNYWSCSGSDGSYCIYNSAIAPDGTNSATTMNISGSGHYYRQVVAVLPSTTYTFSFYVKLGTVDRINYCIYDVANASNIITPTNYYSQIDNEWSKIAVTFTTPSNTTSIGVYPERDASTNGIIYFWGMQLELGPSSTSYIPTTTTSVTRLADIINIPSTNWSSSSGSVFALGEIPNLGTAYFFRWVNDGANRVEMYQGNADQMHMTISTPTTVSNVGYSKFTQRSTTGEYDVFAGRWNVGTNIKMFVDGVIASSNGGIQPQPEAMTNMPNIVNLGGASGFGYVNGMLSRFVVYSSALSDSDIATIGSIINQGL